MVTSTLLLLTLAASADPAALKARIAELSVIEKSQGALDALLETPAESLPWLTGAATEGTDLSARGWAIVGLARLAQGGKVGDAPLKTLVKLSADGKQPQLVRTWAASGRINAATTMDALLEVRRATGGQPALRRPFQLKVKELSSASSGDADALLRLAAGDYQLQQDLVDLILAQGQDKLVKVMASSADQNARQMAAAYLGTLAQKQGKAGNELVGIAVIKAYAFDPAAKSVPWANGPLYVPNIGWEKQTAKELVRNLVSWHAWCDRRPEFRGEKSKIDHNLNSISLGNVLGYQPNWGNQTTAHWLQVWKQVAGQGAHDALLEQVGGKGSSK